MCRLVSYDFIDYRRPSRRWMPKRGRGVGTRRCTRSTTAVAFGYNCRLVLKPREPDSGSTRMGSTSSGESRIASGSPGESREVQESPDEPRRAQESPGEPK